MGSVFYSKEQSQHGAELAASVRPLLAAYCHEFHPRQRPASHHAGLQVGGSSSGVVGGGDDEAAGLDEEGGVFDILLRLQDRLEEEGDSGVVVRMCHAK